MDIHSLFIEISHKLNLPIIDNHFQNIYHKSIM